MERQSRGSFFREIRKFDILDQTESQGSVGAIVKEVFDDPRAFRFIRNNSSLKCSWKISIPFLELWFFLIESYL